MLHRMDVSDFLDLAHLANDARLFQILHTNTFPSGLRHAWITPFSILHRSHLLSNINQGAG